MVRIRRGEPAERLQATRRRKDGTLIEVTVTVSPLCDGAGQVIGAVARAHENAGHQRAAADLAVLRERLRKLRPPPGADVPAHRGQELGPGRGAQA